MTVNLVILFTGDDAGINSNRRFQFDRQRINGQNIKRRRTRRVDKPARMFLASLSLSAEMGHSERDEWTEVGMRQRCGDGEWCNADCGERENSENSRNVILHKQTIVIIFLFIMPRQRVQWGIKSKK